MKSFPGGYNNEHRSRLGHVMLAERGLGTMPVWPPKQGLGLQKTAEN
jgi:hypothetical protein